VTGAGQARLDYANSKDAPKKLFFPESEVLMRYRRGPKGMELVALDGDVGEVVLFGVRPCDARSFALLDKLFDQETWSDPYYVEKREKTTVVSLACADVPYSTCFCTSLGGSPTGSEGADVLLTDLGGDVLAEFLTPKGERLRPYFGDRAAGAGADARKQEVSARAEGQIRSQVPAREVKRFLDANFEHPVWDTIAKSCLACGTCTYACPTCHCFDISDEVRRDDGIRLRNWDSCMYPLFTKETSGHNPRASQKQRWRQRVMHKFRYYVDNFDEIACVGCGRCVQACPANIDIRKIVRDLAAL